MIILIVLITIIIITIIYYYYSYDCLLLLLFSFIRSGPTPLSRALPRFAKAISASEGAGLPVTPIAYSFRDYTY